MKKICLVCGKEFEGYHTSKYCCITCRNFYLTYHKPYPDSGIRICENCGKEYTYVKGQDNWKCENSLSTKNSGKQAFRFCSYKCGCQFTQKQTEKSISEKYNVENISQLESIKKKKEETSLKHFGTKNPMQIKNIKDKCFKNRNVNSASIKMKDWWKQLPNELKQEIVKKRKQTNLERYGVNTIFELETPDWKLKRYLTKKKNNTFTISNQENKIYKLLQQKFIDTKRQYKSEKYPFSCDFYIPSLDLYIEYQGHWSHGKHPFKNISDDLKILNIWKEKAKISKFYKNAIDVWIRRDPKKREIALQNRLNWLEFFTIEEFMNWYDSYKLSK